MVSLQSHIAFKDGTASKQAYFIGLKAYFTCFSTGTTAFIQCFSSIVGLTFLSIRLTYPCFHSL